MTGPPLSPWPHRVALVLSGLTLVLVGVGGLVKGTHSGLAVPDWPLSYGRLLPPMVGGILFEHGHRLLGAAVGLLTIVLNVAVRREARAVRWGAAAALALVVFQGGLGGATVLLGLSSVVSIAHAVFAAAFFAVTISLALATSPSWRRAPDRTPPEEPGIPLRDLALLALFTAGVQILLGAVSRHTGHALGAHIVNAAVLFVVVGAVVRRLSMFPAGDRTLWRLGVGIAAVFGGQVALGGVVLVDLLWGAGAWGLRGSLVLSTAHVLGGSVLLGLCAMLVLECARRWTGDRTPGRPRDYVRLTKPGISVFSAAGAFIGFFLGSRGAPDPLLGFHAVVGTLLVSAGACALNMLFESDVDGRMDRTRERPLPARRLRPGQALWLGALLAAGGLCYLASLVNPATAAWAGAAAGIYLYVYTPLKKRTPLNTVAGAVAGALPPVLGWTAAGGRPEAGAWLLFALMFLWQFPHVFSLAWLHRADYARAGLVMLPGVEGDGRRTGRRALWSVAALVAVSGIPAAVGWGGPAYVLAAAALGAAFLAAAGAFARERSDPRARRLFLASLIYLPALFALLATGNGGRP